MDPRLSKNEERLYNLIPQNGERIDTDALLRLFYYRTEVPLNGRVYIANLIRSLKRKWRVVPEMKRVESTGGSGRRAVEVWLRDRRGRRQEPRV